MCFSRLGSPFSSLPRPSPQPSVTPSTASYENYNAASQANTYIPTPQSSPYIPTASDTSYTPVPQASPRFMDYSNLNNYNTAPRGWGQVKDYYRPVTFDTPKSGNLIYTDF